ncbi:MAG: L,D-transpeptidase [Flavobacteriales bacterium]
MRSRSVAFLLVALPLMADAQEQPRRQGLADMLLEYFDARFPGTAHTQDLLYVSVQRQRMYHLHDRRMMMEYVISTSNKGLGSVEGSERTPEGLHRIAQKIGQGVPAGGLLRERIFTGRFADPSLGQDQVTARILWLEGMEPGHNSGGTTDSRTRSIYIHGTPFEDELGRPASHGCIRMADADIIDLFERLPIGTLVIILDN